MNHDLSSQHEDEEDKQEDEASHNNEAPVTLSMRLDDHTFAASVRGGASHGKLIKDRAEENVLEDDE